MGYREPNFEYDDQGRQTGLSQAGRDFYAEGDRISANNAARWNDTSGHVPFQEVIFSIIQEVFNKKTLLLWIIVGVVLYNTHLAAYLGDKLPILFAGIAFLVSPRFRAFAFFIVLLLLGIAAAFWFLFYILGLTSPHTSRPGTSAGGSHIAAPSTPHQGTP